MAWAPIGSRARRRDFFVRGKRYSILPAISLDGVLHLDVRNESWTGETFYQFIEGLLNNINPFPQRNSVIIMDNASIHHSPELRELIEDRCAFSSIKAWIHSNQAYVQAELSDDPTADPYGMIWEAVFTAVTPKKAKGWYQDCGYLAA
ncbi:hypothetical protein HYDPIDRAFT_89305 [Hydnomerulius pinastri MD-312]|uniref:Tc1-like transposase DDE domain-containing protein n=1 Tax=Hydnomerulius pinastri MD-312 TaxID=994086 RepID=A0A0C9WG01_9AGAM|nr:hypothetical protein HYDPIDRAFT_89305 [Hydnomerulius pinastri MD-312]